MEVVKNALLWSFFLMAATPLKANDWFVVGKEGECTSPSILEKKGPEFRGIETPYQMAEKLRAAGHKTEIKEHQAGSFPATEVRVLDIQFYVMFMEGEVCRKNGALKP